ncbi:MAG: hypothetical protein HC794_10870 [Nitrospiraceae bacterium]|nr:hypothetical protein [Nitrospiraceae bacterium]
MPLSKDDVTALLDAWSQGEPRALERLMDVVHDELRALSRHLFRRERKDHTLQPTALVHEVYCHRAAELTQTDHCEVSAHLVLAFRIVSRP